MRAADTSQTVLHILIYYTGMDMFPVTLKEKTYRLRPVMLLLSLSLACILYPLLLSLYPLVSSLDSLGKEDVFMM